jgi:hypothetical protein
MKSRKNKTPSESQKAEISMDCCSGSLNIDIKGRTTMLIPKTITIKRIKIKIFIKNPLTIYSSGRETRR